MRGPAEYRLEEALAWSLDAIKTGRQSLRGCLDLFPRHRKQLARLLPLALEIRQAPVTSPPLGFRRELEGRLMEEYHSISAQLHRAKKRRELFRWPSRRKPGRPRLAWAPAAALAVVLFLASWAVNASSSALPGEPLYRLKTSLEEVQLALSAGSARETELRLAFADRRLEEVESLLQAGLYPPLSEPAIGLARQMGEIIRSLALEAAEGNPQAEELLNVVREELSAQSQLLSALKSQASEQAAPLLDKALQTTQLQITWIDSFSELQGEAPAPRSAGVLQGLSCWPDWMNRQPPAGIKPCQKDELPSLAPIPSPFPSPQPGRTSTPASTMIPLPPVATPIPPLDRSVHIADLDAAVEMVDGTEWQAIVTVLVHDQNHQPISRARVVVQHMMTGPVLTICVSDTAGLCTLPKMVFPDSLGMQVITVVDVIYPDHSFALQDCHDPDGDSDGVRLPISRPWRLPDT